jgi:integrase
MPFDKAEQNETNVARGSRKKKLTDTLIRNLKSDGKRQTLSDEICRGLTLRLGATSTKTWAYMGRDCHGKNRTVTIGRYPEMTLKAARETSDKLRQTFAEAQSLSHYLAAAIISDEITLLDLLIEAEQKFSPTKQIWKKRGKKSDASTARQVIATVFFEVLHRPAYELTAERISDLVHSYTPKSLERTGKTSANGQVSKALSYLRTVFNWASHRTPRFVKLGAGRKPKLILADLAVVYDPSIDDPTITGGRDRVLSVDELLCILPHLSLPKTSTLSWWQVDLRPIAQRFILLTLARREEIEAARWHDVNFDEKSWTKQVKGGHQVTHPLSQAAVDLLKSLPGYAHRKDSDYIFPNQDHGPLGNWDRSKLKLQEGSNIENWHRHDLRRTGATILSLFGIPPQVVDTLLSHKNPMSKVSVSPSLQSYAKLAKEMRGLPNPLRDAVEILADAISAIEARDL